MIPISFVHLLFNKNTPCLNILPSIFRDKFDLIIIKIIHIYYNSIFNTQSHFFTNFIKNSKQFKMLDNPNSKISNFFNIKIKKIDNLFRKELRSIKKSIIQNKSDYLTNKYKTIYFIMNEKKKEIYKEKQNFISLKKKKFLEDNLKYIQLFFFKIFYNQNIVNGIYNANLNFLISLINSNKNLEFNAIFNIFKNIVKDKWGFANN